MRMDEHPSPPPARIAQSAAIDASMRCAPIQAEQSSPHGPHASVSPVQVAPPSVTSSGNQAGGAVASALVSDGGGNESSSPPLVPPPLPPLLDSEPPPLGGSPVPAVFPPQASARSIDVAQRIAPR